MNDSQKKETIIKAKVLDKLLKHLDNNKNVQNIDLMILAGFCRNCLSKWYQKEAEELDINMNQDEAREIIYGMSYQEWKDKHQKPATEEQLALMSKKKG